MNSRITDLSEFDCSMRVLLQRANAISELIEMANHHQHDGWSLSDDTMQIAATAVCHDLKNSMELLKEFSDRQRQTTIQDRPVAVMTKGE